MDMKAGDVLMFDHSAEKPLLAGLNGETKWQGYMAAKRETLVFEVAGVLEPAPA